MKTTHASLLLALVLEACSSTPSNPTPPSGGLTADERALARSVPSHGNVSFMLPNGREYVGGLNLVVALGLDSGDRAQFAGSAVATDPTGSVGIDFVVPLDQVDELAAQGLDVSIDLPEFPATTFGGDLNGYARYLHLRADPDGLFVVTFTVDTVDAEGVEDGNTVEVDVHGRLSGGCERMVEDGILLTIVDVMSEPVCASVLGSL